jgi:hypothetical protein
VDGQARQGAECPSRARQGVGSPRGPGGIRLYITDGARKYITSGERGAVPRQAECVLAKGAANGSGPGRG